MSGQANGISNSNTKGQWIGRCKSGRLQSGLVSRSSIQHNKQSSSTKGVPEWQ